MSGDAAQNPAVATLGYLGLVSLKPRAEFPMQFKHTPEHSTELLRQALPMMSRQSAALHPVSYAVWYAYVADSSSALHAEVDQVLAEQGKLDEATTQAIYQRHVAGLDADLVQRASDGLQRVMGGMSAQAALATGQTQRYGHTLERMAAALANPDAAAASTPPAEVVGELLAHTQQMQAAMSQLQSQLADSQREIGRLRDEVDRARHDSLVDTLTGLANRRAFDLRMADCLAVASADGPPTCLVLADLDHFKRINDTYGHGFGDQVLRVVAQLLHSMAPKAGLAARVGGEEFALLLPATPVAEAHALAERVRATLSANRIRRKGQNEANERVTLSLGATAWQEGDSAQSLFDRADRALYAAKAAGRDQVVVLG
jgi:diguanylate cyclase